jgi:hypothetical protein
MALSRPIGKEDIEYRVDDWKERLDAFMDQIEEWSHELGFEVQRGAVEQWPETLMKEHGVAPRTLPTLTVSHGKRRIFLTPGELWILGANGRINARTNEYMHTIFDMGGWLDQPPNWQIVNSDISLDYIPVNKESFVKLLNGNLFL